MITIEFLDNKELEPPKIGDWGIFSDDDYDGIVIGQIEDIYFDSDDDGVWNVYYLHGQPYGIFHKIDITKPLQPQIDEFLKQNKDEKI